MMLHGAHGPLLTIHGEASPDSNPPLGTETGGWQAADEVQLAVVVDRTVVYCVVVAAAWKRVSSEK